MSPINGAETGNGFLESGAQERVWITDQNLVQFLQMWYSNRYQNKNFFKFCCILKIRTGD